jgi:hypothetical protein
LQAPPRRPVQDFKPGLGYYKFHTNAQTWLAARHTCTQEGAHLLIVNSDDEFATVKGIWDKYPKLFQDWKNDYVHIGITDLAEEGNFTTMYGKSSFSSSCTFFSHYLCLCIPLFLQFVVGIMNIKLPCV